MQLSIFVELDSVVNSSPYGEI